MFLKATNVIEFSLYSSMISFSKFFLLYAPQPSNASMQLQRLVLRVIYMDIYGNK